MPTVEPRGHFAVESGRPRSSFQQKRGRGRQGSSAIDAPAGGPSLPMTSKARRFTLADLRLSDGAENKSGIAVYRPCITEQIVGVGNALIFFALARTR